MKKLTAEQLRDYFNQGADGPSKEQVRKWFVETGRLPNNGNGGADKELRTLWDDSQMNPILAGDKTEKAFLTILQKITSPGNVKKKSLVRIVANAAAVLLLPALVTTIYLFTSMPEPVPVTWTEVYVPNGEKTEVLLPDGSTVLLNAGSYMFFPGSFESGRHIFLSGEALIDVVRDEDRPFTVGTQGVNIEVLGTLFNVRAYSGDRYTETSLLDGSISLHIKDNMGQTFLMQPGDRILVENITGQVVSDRFDIDHYSSWEQGHYSFRNKTLGEIARDLERLFGVQIIIRDKSLVEEEFFASISKGVDLNGILNILNIHGRLKIDRQDNIIEIRRR